MFICDLTSCPSVASVLLDGLQSAGALQVVQAATVCFRYHVCKYDGLFIGLSAWGCA